MTERKVLKEILAMYRDFDYLWNPNHQLYANKEAREKAHDVLLEKYKQLQEDATLYDVKKKLDNMRTTFRREHKKVLLSKLNGDVEDYVPQLWYYEYMLFLNEVSEYNLDTSKLNIAEDFEESTPSTKRFKPAYTPTIYISDPFKNEADSFENEIGESYNNDDDDSDRISIKRNQNVSEDKASESEAFGTVVGLQLKDVDKTQRAIAEKLISDVVFLARMNKLSIQSTVIANT